MKRENSECFSVTLRDLDLGTEGVEYGFRMSGPWNPSEGHTFDDSRILNDPFALSFSPSGKSRVMPRDAFEFDWGDDRSPSIPDDELVIYELNVHNFTASPSSGTPFPGTFRALREKIPYLKDLGINCVELMPIAEFDSEDDSWGYNSIGIFAPKCSYGSPKEFKSLVKSMHEAGIEVILDVVFNHSPLGGEKAFTNNYRYLDNKSYFMLDEDGEYLNFSGCGNTLDWSYTVLREKFPECLIYWVKEYHVDGFRFDLASVFGRGGDGMSLGSFPLLEEITSRAELSSVRLIAEPWDAQGLYQLGMFSRITDGKGRVRWSEWNDRFRDLMRHLVKSDGGRMQEALLRMQGSPDIFCPGALPVNFVTSHDGLSLMDLVSYTRRDDLSWNCGHEGKVRPGTHIGRLRMRQIKNFLTLLVLSRGIPMITSGDEMGHTQQGNNNPYNKDDKTVWIDWKDLERHKDIHRFVKVLISLRRSEPLFRMGCATGSILSDNLMTLKWADSASKVQYLLIVNTHWHVSVLPLPSSGQPWRVVLNTGMPSGDDIYDCGCEVALDKDDILVGERSVILLKGLCPEQETTC